MHCKQKKNIGYPEAEGPFYLKQTRMRNEFWNVSRKVAQITPIAMDNAFSEHNHFLGS